jgi:alpha-amylase
MKKNVLLVCYILYSVLTGLTSYAQSTQVLLQGFDWTSCSSGQWYQTVGTEISDIHAAKIDAIWLPPPSDAGSAQGYLPRQYYLLNTQYGTQTQLQSLITNLHNSNIKVLADIVINHRVGTTNWADFTNPTWGCWAVTSDDEWKDNGGDPCGNPDTGEPYAAARDLDHTNLTVQNDIIAWMRWLKNTIGFDGWRYDFTLGYAPKYVKEYNDSTAPYFSVAEYWDPSATNINSWITNSQGSSTAFDFSLKGILQNAVQGNLGSLNVGGKPPGLIGINPVKSVTFIENHDTGPPQNAWPFPAADVMEGYAYILTHPGIPMVFWDHLYTWGLHDQITALIAIRKNNGLTSTSSVNIISASNNLYAAIIDGKVAMKIGSGSWTPGAGYVLKTSGTNYAVWDKIVPPVISSSLTFTDTTGVTSTYKITASNTPTSYHATNLPAGLSIDTTTGFISGASTASGTYTVGIIVTNSAGTDSAKLIIATNIPAVPVTGVNITPPTVSIFVAATTQLTATVTPASATNKNVTWSSSNTTVAIVSTTGLVTAVSAGSATITVTTTDQSKTATSVITVTNPIITVTGVNVTPTTASIITGATTQLTATVAPASATNKNVIWSSSNTTVAIVSTTGLVTAVSSGSAIITVTTADQSKTATSIITVINPIVSVTGISITPTTTSIITGATIQLTATVSPASATNKNITWSSSNTTVATVSTTGLVTAVSVGSATITVTTADQSKTATSLITITNPIITVTGVSITPTTASIITGATIQLTATVSPASATNKNITWSSSNTTVATVSTTGLVTAVSVGSATITVTTADKNKAAISIITVPNITTIVTPIISYAGGSTNICNGQSITLVSSVFTGNQWYKNGAIITGAIVDTLQVTTSGAYTVTSTISGIMSPVSAGVAISVLSVPAAPTISESRDSILISSVISDNQWYADTTIIISETLQQYEPNTTGLYAVTTKENGCISLLSDQFYFLKKAHVSVYPNPATDFIIINYNTKDPVMVNIFTPTGKEVISKEITQSGNEISIAALQKGIYFIKIFNETVQSVIKIVKL